MCHTCGATAPAGRIPSPEGKVAERQRGRKRNGDSLPTECSKSKTAKFLNLYPINQLPKFAEHFAIPLQSQKMVSKSHFLCQLMNCGMIATGNHLDLNPLRGAPPPG